MPQTTRYNGWANYETWNVALWIGNDEPLYRHALEYARHHKGRLTGDEARQFCRELFPNGTPDTNNLHRVRWTEIAAFLRELGE